MSLITHLHYAKLSSDHLVVVFVAFQKRVTNREVEDVSSGGHSIKNIHNALEGC